MPKPVIVAPLLILILMVFISAGCTMRDLQQPSDPQSIQLQGAEVEVGGRLGPRHGPYGR